MNFIESNAHLLIVSERNLLDLSTGPGRCSSTSSSDSARHSLLYGPYLHSHFLLGDVNQVGRFGLQSIFQQCLVLAGFRHCNGKCFQCPRPFNCRQQQWFVFQERNSKGHTISRIWFYWSLKLMFCFWTEIQLSLINLGAIWAGAADIPAFRSMRTLRALRPLRAVSRWEGMRVSTADRSIRCSEPCQFVCSASVQYKYTIVVFTVFFFVQSVQSWKSVVVVVHFFVALPPGLALAFV